MVTIVCGDDVERVAVEAVAMVVFKVVAICAMTTRKVFRETA